MGPDTARILGGLRSGVSSANWLCGWRARIRVGVTTGSWEPFPTLDRNSRIRTWATSFAGTALAGTETERKHDLEGLHRSAYGGVGRCRFLHRRSADVARFDHLLRAVLPASGDPA